MGCLLLPLEKRYLNNVIMSGNPSKKIRLDFQNKYEESTGNEDLWGQDDLTAEEFDMLEVQATQSCNQSVIYQNNVHHNNHDEQNSFTEISNPNQHQYELEGRVKLLSQSLENSMKELNKERLNRERTINDRMKEFYEREANLQKEIEKMRSILEFKDQEMKSTYSKLQVMKSQLRVRKDNSAGTSVNQNFEDFLKSNSNEDYCNFSTSKSFKRRHKLSIDTPKGEIKGIDLLSSVLCTRLAIPSLQSSENTVNCTHLEDISSNLDFTSMSVVQLKNEQKSDELLEHYKCFLKSHVAHLKTLASRSNVTNSNKSSPVAVKRKETGSTVTSFLCDIAYLLSCAKFSPLSKKGTDKNEDSSANNEGNVQIEVTKDFPSEHLLHNQDSGTSSVCGLTGILEPLLVLTDPKTYPIGYPKNEEIEYSLSALLTICMAYPKKFLDLGFELPIHSFSNPHQSVTALCTTLKLLTTLCSCKSFSLHLTHKNNNCILCLTAAFLVNIVPYYPEKFSSSVVLVEDFLSLIFSTHDIAEIHLDTSDCISKVIQGIIKSIWKYYQLKENSNLKIQIIKKGFLLLHTMSSYIPNFKERRHSAEDEYISLITSILAVSKENVEFREFYDIIHTLWDFQTDTTEFDLDELTEETQASTNEINIVE